MEEDISNRYFVTYEQETDQENGGGGKHDLGRPGTDSLELVPSSKCQNINPILQPTLPVLYAPHLQGFPHSSQNVDLSLLP